MPITLNANLNAQYTNNAQMPNTLNDKTPHKCKYEQAAGSSYH